MTFPSDILEFLEYVNKKQNSPSRKFNPDRRDLLDLIDYNMIWANTLDGDDYWIQAVDATEEVTLSLIRNSKEYGSWQFQYMVDESVEFDPSSIQLLKQFTEDN